MVINMRSVKRSVHALKLAVRLGFRFWAYCIEFDSSIFMAGVIKETISERVRTA